MNRLGLAALAAAFVFVATFAPSAEAKRYRRTVSRQRSVQRMPITQRPNRPGHVVGNTIRFFAR